MTPGRTLRFCGAAACRSNCSATDTSPRRAPRSGSAKLLADANWIVDALLGTGARGEPRPPLDAVIDQINAAAAKRLAVDLPSGLDCDTGVAARHTIRADETCTFVAMKRGFLSPGADRYTGRVHVLDIGAPRKLVEEIVGWDKGA